MNLTKRMVGDVAVLDLSGNVMGGPDHQEFHEAIKEIVEAGHRKVLVNLADVPWINSTGLGILMAGFITVKNAGGTLRLVSVGKRVENLLTITRLSLIFDTYAEEAEALRSFAD
jgi:anti-anti-sigma factor